MTVIGDVKGGDVVLVDDLVDTAGTLCKAADALIEKGAKSVRAICTHPILSGKAYENIEKSKLTGVHRLRHSAAPHAIPQNQSAADGQAFSRAIRNTVEHKSIASLFMGV